MASNVNISLPDDLFDQAQRLAQAEGKTTGDFAVEAVKKEVARKLLASFPREPSGMTEGEEIQFAVKAVHDFRREQ